MPEDDTWEGRFEAAARTPLTDPPRAAVLAARELFRVHQRERRKDRPSVLAQLFFDSRSLWGGAPALARESASSGGAVLRRFAADEREVEVWQEALPGGAWFVLCQCEGAVSVQLEQDGTSFVAEPVVEGEWHFAELPSGRYALRVVTSGSDLLVPQITFGADGP